MLSPEQIGRLDPYQLMAELGKRIIHPGGRRSTEELLELAELQPEHEVLEVGCGVGATAVEIAQRFGCKVTAVDLDEAMISVARRNVEQAGLIDRIELRRADIVELPFADASFDRVIIEAVTMFVDRERAAREVVRVCRPGGRVLDHEFIWRKPPPPRAREIFVGEVCPGITFDSAEDWVRLYESAGLSGLRVETGPFAMMTPWGFVRDEGVAGTLHFAVRACSRLAYLRKMAWLVRRIARSMPYLGYAVVAGDRP